MLFLVEHLENGLKVSFLTLISLTYFQNYGAQGGGIINHPPSPPKLIF